MATYNFTDGGKIYKDDVLHLLKQQTLNLFLWFL
jgi:hypothetical protein